MGIKTALTNITASLEQNYPTQIGFFYGLFCQLLFITANYFARRLEYDHPPFQIVYLFSIQMFLFNYWIIRDKGGQFVLKDTKTNVLAFVRSFMMLVLCGFLFYAFPLMSYGEGQVIFNTSIVLTGILSVFFLAETYDFALFFSTVINFGGVILIAKPSFLFGERVDENFPDRTLGIILMILAALMDGIAYVLLKKLSFGAEASMMAAMLGLFLSLGMGLLQLFNGADMLNFGEYMIMLFIGVLEAGAQYYMGKAFAFGKASIISLTAYTRIVYAYLLEVIIDGLNPDSLSVFGSFLIFSTVFVTIYKNKDKESKAAVKPEKTID